MTSSSEDFTCDDVGLSSGKSFTTLAQEVKEAEEVVTPAQEEPVISQQTEVQEPIEIPRGPDDNSEFSYDYKTSIVEIGCECSERESFEDNSLKICASKMMIDISRQT